MVVRAAMGVGMDRLAVAVTVAVERRVAERVAWADGRRL
jgi:hypothetical protein